MERQIAQIGRPTTFDYTGVSGSVIVTDDKGGRPGAGPREVRSSVSLEDGSAEPPFSASPVPFSILLTTHAA